MKKQIEKYSLFIRYDEIDIRNFIIRYHFDKKDEELLTATARFLTELVTVRAEIQYLAEKMDCVVTLGERFDKFSELAAENLLLSYCVECMGMEFLTKAYEKMNEFVFQKTGKWMGDYYFLDGDSLGEMEEWKGIIEDLSVEWKNGMLRPLKSVIFTAKYTDKREESSCSSCEQCGNVTCSFRKIQENRNKSDRIANTTALGKEIYSYGISRIFGADKSGK